MPDAQKEFHNAGFSMKEEIRRDADGKMDCWISLFDFAKTQKSKSMNANLLMLNIQHNNLTLLYIRKGNDANISSELLVR